MSRFWHFSNASIIPSIVLRSLPAWDTDDGVDCDDVFDGDTTDDDCDIGFDGDTTTDDGGDGDGDGDDGNVGASLMALASAAFLRPSFNC